MKIETLITEVQSRLGCREDGKAGPETWTAVYNHVFGIRPGAEVLASDVASVDPRSEKAIATLHPKVQPLARSLVHAAAEQGIVIKVTSGSRTYAEQDALFAQGGVTKARGGYSNHNFGLAFDVTIFKGAAPVWESPNYKAIGALGRGIGLMWGGDWKSIVDEPHFELRPPWAEGLTETFMLSELRARKARGEDAFA